MRDEKEGYCNVVAETVFAGEHVSDLPGKYGFAPYAHPGKINPEFFKEFFVGNGPGNTGNGDR